VAALARFDFMFYWKIANFMLFAEPEPLAKEEPKPKPSAKAKKKANNGGQVG